MSDTQEYQVKSNPQTMPLPLSAYLKWENTPHTRQTIAAPKGTKMGEFVDYAPYGTKLLALSDEHDGKVMVQPKDCIIEYSNLSEKAIAQVGDWQTLVNTAVNYGIVYRNAPVQAVNALAGRYDGYGHGDVMPPWGERSGVTNSHEELD